MRNPRVFCPMTAEPTTNRTVRTREWMNNGSLNIWTKLSKPTHFGWAAPTPVSALLVKAM